MRLALRLAAFATVVVSAGGHVWKSREAIAYGTLIAGALTAVGSDGKAGHTNAGGTAHYFKKSSITISGLTGDCYIKFDARKTQFSTSPGPYFGYVSGTGDFEGDHDLDDYNHGWRLTSSTSVTYSDLPDGYFFFTSSCTSPYNTYEDFKFAVDTLSPTSKIKPAAGYDPATNDRTVYTAEIDIKDTYGQDEYDEPLKTHYSQPHHYKWRVDEGDWTFVMFSGTKPTLDFSNNYDAGAHCLEVNALDAAHNTEYYASVYCWTVETIDQYEGCTFHYSVNGGEPVSTTEQSVSMTNLPDGTNSFAVYATDAYGNVDATLNTNTFTWTIDTVKPTVSVPVEVSSRGASHSSATFRYEGSDVEAFYKYQVDNGAIVAVPAAVAFTSSHNTTLHRGTFPATSCSGTTHTFSVHAVDLVGNVGDASTYSFLVDPVETTLTLANALAGYTVAGNTAEFAIGAIVDGQTESKFGYEYMVDDGAWIKGKHFPQFGVRGLEEGLHTVTARAVSEDGCMDYSPVTAVVSVDYTAPVTTLHCPPPLVNETSFTVYGVVEDTSIKASGSEFKLGDAPYMPTMAVADDGSFSLVLTDLSEGPYTLKVKSTDNAGHSGEEATCTFVIDQTIPDTAITMGPNSPMMMEETAGFVFACPGETACFYMYSFDGADFKMVEEPSFRCKGLGYHKCVEGPLNAGMHTMMVYAIDAAGNADPTPAAYSFSVFDEEGFAEFSSFSSFSVVGGMTPKSGKARNINKVWGLAAEASGPVDPYAAAGL